MQLLWTGGWDSSFRLLQLLLVEHRPVQPIYVVSTERRSTMQELQAMHRIRDGVLPRLTDPSLLAPTMTLIGEDFPPRPDLLELRWSIRRRGVKVGTQYVLLAAIADQLGWQGVELCMQAHDDGPTDLHRVVFTNDRGSLTDAPEAQLFRYWSFPVLATTKGQMAAVARAHGFMDLLAQRWYCHDPLGDRPCGLCHPCSLAYPAGPPFAPRLLVRARRRLRRTTRSLARRHETLPTRLRARIPELPAAGPAERWWTAPAPELEAGPRTSVPLEQTPACTS